MDLKPCNMFDPIQNPCPHRFREGKQDHEQQQDSQHKPQANFECHIPRFLFRRCVRNPSIQTFAKTWAHRRAILI
jgi:hypothetical protein